MFANKNKAPGTYVHGCIIHNCNNRYYFPITDTTYKNKSFFKFPSKDVERRHKWFNILKLEFTNKQSYLCEDHFEETQFSDTYKKRLLKYAVPSATLCFQNSTGQRHQENASFEEHSGLMPGCSLKDKPSENTEENYFPVSKKPKLFENDLTTMPKINIISNIQVCPPNLPKTENYIAINLHPESNTSKNALTLSSHIEPSMSKTNSISKMKKTKHILATLGETRAKNLTPRKKKLYFVNKTQNNTICKLKHKLKNSKEKLKTAYEFSKNKMFRELEEKLDPAVASFFQNSFANVKHKRPTWTLRDKLYIG